MGFFSKRRGGSGAVAASVATFIGRKFTSSLDVDTCVANYRTAATQCYPVTGDLLGLPWTPPPPAPGFESTQGGAASVAPAAFVGFDLQAGGRICLAVWGGSVSYSGDGTSGPTEMWFVPPGFDGSPIPLPGVWKGLDPSLSSIGNVESPYWGG